MGEPPRVGQHQLVNSRHPGRQHRLELIPRLNAFDDRKHEVERALVSHATFRTHID
jgi:hypothetical protein